MEIKEPFRFTAFSLATVLFAVIAVDCIGAFGHPGALREFVGLETEGDPQWQTRLLEF